MTIAIYTHEECFNHKTGDDHPEGPIRLEKVMGALKNSAKASEFDFQDSTQISEDLLKLCHSERYINHVKDMSPSEGTVKLDEDTMLSPGSLDAALYAAGAAINAVDAVMTGDYKTAFTATRPPGHHAKYDTSMGFCIFNNVALAATYAIKNHGLKRVAVLDFDVHHGNGTQEILEHNQNDTLFISFQESDIWPYNKDEIEIKNDRLLNYAMPQKAPVEMYYEAFEKDILPALHKFQPELICISAGFDAHRDDPPADALFNDQPGRQLLTEPDFNWMTMRLMDIANQYGDGRVVSIMEGGYNPDVLARSVASHVETLLEYSKELETAKKKVA